MANAMTNDDLDLEKLIKILNMLSAENDNIVLISARKATEMLKRADMDWERFARGKITIVNDPFGSIAEPPKATAAPPPRPTPQPTAPARIQRDTVIVARRFALLNANRANLASWQQARLDQVTIDWQHHAPLMSDADYTWLGNESSNFVPTPRVAADVEQYLDTCDFAPLDAADNARVRAIRSTWQSTKLMSMHDFSFLQGLHYRHYKRPKTRRTRRP